MEVPRRLRLALGAIALGIVYAGLYKLILVGSSFGTSIGSPFWPASGVTVSVLILRPRREWPVFVVAIWFGDFILDLHGGGCTVPAALISATANCSEPLVSATLLRCWLGRRPDLRDVHDLGRFFLAAACGGPLWSSVIASVGHAAIGQGAMWPYAGRWYVGDALGVVVIAPVILSIANDRSRPTVRNVAALVGVALGAGAVLTLPFAARDGLPFLVIPVLSLISVWAGTRGAAVAVLLIGVTVEVITSIGFGAFADGGAFTGLLSAQMYMVACSVPSLAAAALMAGLLSRDRLALHDSLTGLANRRLLMDRTSLSLERLARQREAVGLVFIDLDGFKAINDLHGHGVGDEVLVEVARRLRSVVRERDTIARIGGDEFVILVDLGATAATMSSLVERVEQVVTEPIACAGVSVEIGASVGHTICDRHDERPEEALRRADDAMYRVKHARVELGAVPARS